MTTRCRSPWRPAGVLVEIRCPGPQGHLRAVVYRTRNEVRLQYLGEEQRIIDQALTPPRPNTWHVALASGEPALLPGTGGFRRRCRCGGYASDADELREAAARAVSAGRMIVIPARPFSGRW